MPVPHRYTTGGHSHFTFLTRNKSLSTKPSTLFHETKGFHAIVIFPGNQLRSKQSKSLTIPFSPHSHCHIYRIARNKSCHLYEWSRHEIFRNLPLPLYMFHSRFFFQLKKQILSFPFSRRHTIPSFTCFIIHSPQCFPIANSRRTPFLFLSLKQ